MATDASHPPNDPVIVFASFHPLEGQEDEVRELLSWMLDLSRQEPGCERYDLYRRRGHDGTSFHLFERYRDTEALEAHRATDHYVEYRRRIADLIEGTVDVLVLDAIDAVG